jgi:hypothetical protein
MFFDILVDPEEIREGIAGGNKKNMNKIISYNTIVKNRSILIQEDLIA